MLWIVGGGFLFLKLAEITEWGWADALAKQMHHAKWGSFHFFDLIFPLFILMSGVVIPYSLYSRLDKGESKKSIYLKIIKRFVILVVLGAVYNGALQFKFSELRVASVLGLIGGAYAIGALIAVNFRSAKSLGIWVLGILLGYGVLQLFIPVPGYGAGVLNGEGSWNGYIDRLLMPGKLLSKTMDPEGILAVVVSSSITLMGVWAGMLLKRDEISPYKKTGIIAGVGGGFVVVALILKTWYPIIKGLATVPYIMLSGGLSLLLLALFYLVIDVWKVQRWTLFFRVIGMNSITIYLAVKIFDFWKPASFIFGGVSRYFGDFAPLIIGLGVICVEWIFLYFLYGKKFF
ncbi:acyltransferase family protein [Pontiella agarivorans]